MAVAERNIFPEEGGDKIVVVHESTWSVVSEGAKRLTASQTGFDTIVEYARKVLQADRDARIKAERHANGDFRPETEKLKAIAEDIYLRTDGEAADAPYEAMSDLDDLLSRSGLKPSVEQMKKFYTRMSEANSKTTELIVAFGAAIAELEA